MKNVRSFPILFLCCLFGVILFSGCSSSSSDDKLISTLKTFNGTTTYEQVEKSLSQPTRTYATKKTTDRKYVQTMEWKLDDGNVRIVFMSKTSSSPQRVTRVEYVNARGETAYSYKLLKD
jgi:hypothetical protein